MEAVVPAGIALTLAAHFLLPIGIAFPAIRLGPVPVHLPVLLYPWFFVPAIRACWGDVNFRRGLVFLTALVVVQAATLLYSDRPIQGAYEWFLNVFRLPGAFVVAWFMVSRVPPRRWVSQIAVLLAVAAAIGIAERVLSRPLPPYAGWYSDWYLRVGTIESPGELPGTFRIWGTLGNPITYCCLLMLGIPWVAAVEGRFLRTVTIILCVVAAALTLSRTIVFFAPLAAFGLVAALRFNKARLFAGVVLVAGTVVAVGVATGVFDRIRELWELRLLAESVSDTEGVSSRVAILELCLREFTAETNPLLWLFGHGQGSGAIIAARVLSNLDTVDNEFAALLFENGVVGLGLFLAFWAGLLGGLGLRPALRSMHYWAIVAYLLCGASFEVHRTFTLNLLVFASLAWLWKSESLRAAPANTTERSVLA